MSTVITILVIISGIIILSVMIFLVYLNWSYKVQASLISIILVGTGTILVTIFSGLKDQKIIERFIATVFVNDTTVRYAVFPNKKSRMYGRSQILSQYSDQSTAGVHDDRYLWFDKYKMPSNDEEWFDFNREAYTYDIFKYIWALSTSGAVYDFSEGLTDIGILKIDLPDDCIPVQFKSLNSKFEKFHGVEYEGAFSDLGGMLKINVPKGTKIRFYNIKETDHYPVSVLEFKKNLYFDITFKVTRITDPSSNIPSKLIDKTVNTSKIRSYSYNIEMSANFSKYSSSGDKSSQYVLWSNSLFAAVKQVYDDKNL